MMKDLLVVVLFTGVPSGMNSLCTVPDESKNSSSLTLPFDLTCHGFFFLGDDCDFQVAFASVVDCTENTMFFLLL
jgi:hypothetical protein